MSEEPIGTSEDIVLLVKNSCEMLVPSTEHSAGIDLPAAAFAVVAFGHVTIVDTGVYVNMPPNFYGMICSRSGLAARHGVMVVNAPGIIDADYKDTIKVLLTKVVDDPEPFMIAKGDRIAQIVFAPRVKTSGSTSAQRIGGLGSTGV